MSRTPAKTGEQVKGVFNGAGILTTDTSDRFEGQWSDGKMNGFGVLRRADGERYAGDWKDDQPNGDGELRHADGKLEKGLFAGGKLVKVDTVQDSKTAKAETRHSEPAIARSTGASSVTDSTTTALAPEVSV